MRALLPSSPGCLTVVTSRDQMGGLVASNAVSVIELDVLDQACAMALLVSLLDDVRLRQDVAATNELIELCAGLPLALRIAAAHLVANRALTVRSMVQRLRADLLATLAIGPNSATAVSAAFDISFATLSAPTQQVFSLLGAVGCRDYSPEAVAALAGERTRGGAQVPDRTGLRAPARTALGRPLHLPRPALALCRRQVRHAR